MTPRPKGYPADGPGGRVRSKLLCGAALLVLGILGAQPYLSTLPIPSSYRSAEDNAAARLARDLASGKVSLTEPYLPSLLEHLHIPIDSQALVFSKTSFQATRISPRNPRSIYFSDDAAVGWVRGSDAFEVAALDSHEGVVFYSFSPDPPTLTRREECLHCHHGTATQGVPGMFIGSVFPDSSGKPAHAEAIITDHRTPFADRWGGWYVNAARGQQPDRSNSFAIDPAEPFVLATTGRQNLRTLNREFNSDGYLSPVSDIVALMTFEHQTQMANYFTRLAWESRAGQNIDADLETTLDYMLFVDEAPLKEPIEGVSTFTRTFPQRGPRDHQGRSLRDFDLQTRLFRYPLSFMIYSPLFDALPEPVRHRLSTRLHEILSGQDHSPKFAHLLPADLHAILEILKDTMPGLAADERR